MQEIENSSIDSIEFGLHEPRNFVASEIGNCTQVATKGSDQIPYAAWVQLRQVFLDHPASVNETYLQHLDQPSGFVLRMIGGGLKSPIHAFLLFIYVGAGSDCVSELHHHLSYEAIAAMKLVLGNGSDADC